MHKEGIECLYRGFCNRDRCRLLLKQWSSLCFTLVRPPSLPTAKKEQKPLTTIKTPRCADGRKGARKQAELTETSRTIPEADPERAPLSKFENRTFEIEAFLISPFSAQARNASFFLDQSNLCSINHPINTIMAKPRHAFLHFNREMSWNCNCINFTFVLCRSMKRGASG